MTEFSFSVSYSFNIWWENLCVPHMRFSLTLISFLTQSNNLEIVRDHTNTILPYKTLARWKRQHTLLHERTCTILYLFCVDSCTDERSTGSVHQSSTVQDDRFPQDVNIPSYWQQQPSVIVSIYPLLLSNTSKAIQDMKTRTRTISTCLCLLSCACESEDSVQIKNVLLKTVTHYGYNT